MGGQAYSYAATGNLLGGGGRPSTWTVENQPATVTSGGVTESYAYDADNSRVTCTRAGTTIVYLAGLYEEETSGTTRRLYPLNGQVVAQRERVGSSDTILYLHSDHLGSVNVVTNASGGVVSRQEFTPFGEVRPTIGDITQTSRDFTGQRRDGTGLLYYGARYYDPTIAKFVSPDSIVPGVANGSGGGAASLGYDERTALRPLTVDFHEAPFVVGLEEETRLTLAKGFWFQLDEQGRQQATVGWGPADPQALNRYSYVLNNPVRYTDPTGHLWETVVDLAFIVYDLYQLFTGDEEDWEENLTALRLDVLSAVLPGVTGLGTLRRITLAGRAGERAAGIVRNTQRIPSLTGTAKYRIPDGLSHVPSQQSAAGLAA